MSDPPGTPGSRFPSNPVDVELISTGADLRSVERGDDTELNSFLSLQADDTGQYLLMFDGNFDEIPGLRQKLALTHFARKPDRYRKHYADIAFVFRDFRTAGVIRRAYTSVNRIYAAGFRRIGTSDFGIPLFENFVEVYELTLPPTFLPGHEWTITEGDSFRIDAHDFFLRLAGPWSVDPGLPNTADVELEFTSGYTVPDWLTIEDDEILITEAPPFAIDNVYIVEVTGHNDYGTTDGTIMITVRDRTVPIIPVPTPDNPNPDINIPSDVLSREFELDIEADTAIIRLDSMDISDGNFYICESNVGVGTNKIRKFMRDGMEDTGGEFDIDGRTFLGMSIIGEILWTMHDTEVRDQPIIMIPYDFETGAGLLGAFTLKDPNPTGASAGVPGTPGISTYYGVVFQPSFGFLFFRNRFDNFAPNESDRLAYKRFQGRFGFYSQDPIAGVSDGVLSASGIAYNPLTGYWIGNTDDGVDSAKNYTALLSHLPANAIEINADNRQYYTEIFGGCGPCTLCHVLRRKPK